MRNNPDNLRSKAHAGFSLIDVMVGMVIAMLGVIIIFQVFSVSEKVKSTTTGGGDALQNGAVALFALERSLKEAGYGIFASTNLFPIPADPLGTAPVTILAGGAPACLAAGAAVNSDCIVIIHRQNWDFGSFPPDPTVFASGVPPALTIETITVNAQAQLVSNTIPDPAPGGPITPYATLPATPVTTTVISDGIALLKAEYGTDANANGVIDANEWNQAAPANVLTVYAVRLAVVARSAQPEKPGVLGGACDTTTVFPAWIGSYVTAAHPVAAPSDISGNVGLAAGDDWKCYRYKTFENTVLLRNVVWRP